MHVFINLLATATAMKWTRQLPRLCTINQHLSPSETSLSGDAENARHENAGLENAAQTCRLMQEVENARLETWHKNTGLENAGMENAAQSR